MKNKAFTLVEVCIVLVIIGLTAAMAIPAFMKVRFHSIEKALAAGNTVGESDMKFYRENISLSTKKGWEAPLAREREMPVPAPIAPVVTPDTSSVPTVKIDGVTYFLIPKATTQETRINGTNYWIIPAK